MQKNKKMHKYLLKTSKNENPNLWPKRIFILIILLLLAFIISLILQYFQEKTTKQNIKTNVALQNKPTKKITQSTKTESYINKPVVAYKTRPFYNHAIPLSDKYADNSYFNDAVFIGDLQTKAVYGYMKDVFPQISVIADEKITLKNISTTEQIEHENQMVTVLDKLKLQTNKNKIYILIGANDLDLSKDEFVFLYESFINEIKQAYPFAEIYLQSIPPINESEFNKNNINKTNFKINEYNFYIMNIAKENNVYFLDIATVFMDDFGQLNKDATYDGVNFIGEYYFLWFDYLKKHIPVK